MSSINANATVTLTVNGKQAQDMLDSLKKKSVDLEKAIEDAAKAGDKAKLTRLQRELTRIADVRFYNPLIFFAFIFSL